jgi:hypothetical protein
MRGSQKAWQGLVKAGDVPYAGKRLTAIQLAASNNTPPPHSINARVKWGGQ